MDMSKMLVFNGNGKATHVLVWESGYPWLQEIVTGVKTFFLQLYLEIQKQPKFKKQNISLFSSLDNKSD